MSDHHHASISVSGVLPGQPHIEVHTDHHGAVHVEHHGAVHVEHHGAVHKEHKEKKHGGGGHDSDSSSDEEKKKKHPDLIPIQGYESANFEKAVVLAPPPPPVATTADAAPQKFDSMAGITEDQAKKALLKYVSDHCCFKTECAEKMDIKKMTTAGALHYVLETFTEHREIKCVFEPYKNQPVDGPNAGPAPAPWTVTCNPDSEFKDHAKKVEVPHTAVVKNCFRCKGKGHVKCKNCKGDGDKSCDSCNGTGSVNEMNAEGQPEDRACPHCTDGKVKCSTCGGDGKVKCPVCDGHKNLKQFIQMTCAFKNEKDDFVHEKSDLPDHLIKDVKGELVFEQVVPQVNPITGYSVDDINKNSARLVEKHRGSYNDKRKLKQRHQLRAVPVSEIEYHWKDVKDRYWVYGKEHKVHAPTYPQQSCCTVL